MKHTHSKDGVTYRIVERKLVTSGRNFGKTFYRLQDDQGRNFCAMAKGDLKHNSRLSRHDY